MLLASAPLREWSLLSSRPTSRAHDRSLRQGDPTRRTKLTNHVPRIHYHCLNPVARSSSIHPPNTHLASIDWLKTRAYEFKWGRHSMMPDANQGLPQLLGCPWERTEKSATHQNMYHLPPIIRQHAGHRLRLPCMMQSACLTYKVPLSARYIEHTPYGQPPTIGLPEPQW